MEETDVRLVIKKFLRRWPFFLASLVLAQTGAYLYIQSAEKVYLIQASLQLKDQNLSEKGDGNKKFINGLELLESDAVLEDEIGILSAFSTIRQTVEKIGDFTKVYRSNSAFTGLDRFFSTETHKEGVSVVMDKDRPQLIDTPVHLSFVDSDTFLVEVNSTDACLYDFRSHRTVEGKHTVTIHQKGVVGKPFMSRFLSFTLWPADKNGDYWNSRYYFVNHSLKRTVESYQRRLNVAPIADESNIVNLTLKGVIPEKECVFLNTLSAVYVENDMRRKNQLGLRTIDFIDQQLGRVADTLNQVEGKLERFRASSRVIDIGASAQTLTDLLNRLEEKQTERKTQNQYYAYIEAYLSRNASLNEIVAPSMAGIADPSLTKLLNDLNDLNKERIAIAYNSSGDNNPILRILDMKIENTKKTLVEDVRNLIRSGTISIAENQRRIDQVKLKIERLPENERSLNNIQRGFRLNSEVYSYLLEKRAEASIAMASSAPDKSVVDTARQVGDKPVSPNPSLVYLVAMMLGLAAPAGLIGFRSYLDKRVEDESELEQKTHIPIIASVVYDTQTKRHRPITANTYNDSTFQAVRRYLQFNKTQLIGITSMASNDGKTYCAINLAAAFANAGHKTLLIDTDFYRADISAIFNLQDTAGLINFLPDVSSVAVSPTSIENLYVIGVGQSFQQSRSVFLRSSFEQLLEKLRHEYAYIVVDTCPVGIISDYLHFSDHMDYSLFVVRDQLSEWKDILRLNKLLVSHKLKDKSAIIYNGVKTSEYYNGSVYYRKIAS